jgi:hypothetical protein
MMFIPVEVSIFGVYFPPLLIAAIIGTLAATLTARVLNRYRLSRYFFFPPIVLIAIMVVYTCIIGTVFIQV